MTLTIDRPPLHAPRDDGTRREFIAGGLTLAALVAGCGGEDDRASTATDARYPRTVRHGGGSSVLQRRPRRVVVSQSFITLDSLLALGVQPVANGERPNTSIPRWTEDALTADGILTFDFSAPKIERIAATKPDLIVVKEGEAEMPYFAPFRKLADDHPPGR